MSELITVRLFATLGRKYAVTDTVDLAKPRVISDILDEIGIPDGKVTIMLVDGKHANEDAVVRPGQKLSLFPPIGGG
jgi:sulfur carrier protein ThiS